MTEKKTLSQQLLDDQKECLEEVSANPDSKNAWGELAIVQSRIRQLIMADEYQKKLRNPEYQMLILT